VRRLAVAFAGFAAALAGTAGMGLVREQAAGLDGGPALEASPCRGLCATTFTYDHVGWVATCTELPDDAVSSEALTVADGVITEVRAIDGVDPDRSLAITGRVCGPAGWSLAVPIDEWQLGRPG
jgi:hypothetical protein